MFARRWWPCAGVLIGLSALPPLSPGAVLTFAFEGHVTNVDKNDPSGLFPFGAIGDIVTYAFSFDPATPELDGLPGRARYAGLTSSIVIAGQEFGGGVPSIRIQHPSDLFDVTATVAPQPPGGGLSGSVLFRLSDQTESNALTSLDLPLTPYDLNLFASRGFSATLINTDSYMTLNGHIDEFSAIPEPATLVCLLMGGVFTRRNRRQS